MIMEFLLRYNKIEKMVKLYVSTWFIFVAQSHMSINIICYTMVFDNSLLYQQRQHQHLHLLMSVQLFHPHFVLPREEVFYMTVRLI